MAKTDWPIKTLGEVAVVNPSEPALSEDAPFVPMDAVTSGKRDIQYTQPRGQRSGARARAGDILFARITPCLQNGKVALVQDELARCGGSTEFIVVRAGPDVLNGYLYQWITSDHVRDEVTALMKGATGRQRLNAEDLALAELPVPPLEEQKRIVALLDAATARVTELTACYEQARTHANNLFTSALRDALESNPDWPVKTLGDICRIEMGRTPSRGDSKGWDKAFKTTNHWASIADLTACNGRVLTNTKERISDYAAKTTKVVPAGTLMMSFKLSIGKLAFAGCDLYTNEAIAAFHLHEQSGVDSDFLYWALSVVDWSALTKGSEKVKGATMNKAKLNLLEIPVPPLEEQKQIVARLDSMRAKTSEMVAAYDAKLTAAKNLRQSILEAAFAGDL